MGAGLLLVTRDKGTCHVDQGRLDFQRRGGGRRGRLAFQSSLSPLRRQIQDGVSLHPYTGPPSLFAVERWVWTMRPES